MKSMLIAQHTNNWGDFTVTLEGTPQNCHYQVKMVTKFYGTECEELTLEMRIYFDKTIRLKFGKDEPCGKHYAELYSELVK